MNDLDLSVLRLARADLAERLDTADNRTTISYSETKGLDCWRKHHFSRRMGLRVRDAGAALQFGKAWDAFLNVWQGPRPDPFGRNDDDLFHIALDAGDWSLRKDEQRVLSINQHIPADLDERMADLRTLLMGMAHHYRLRWASDAETWDVLERQVRFRVPLRTASGRRSPKYDLVGVIDVLARHRDTGDLAIIDNKSAASISLDYRMSTDLDRQMPLYAWAMNELGYPVTRALYDVAAKKLPSWPMMRQAPLAIDDPLTGEPLTRPVLDDDGEPVTYKSGARKGEVKLEKVTRPALYSDAHAGTSWPVYLHALDLYANTHGLDASYYTHEADLLHTAWTGDTDDDAFFWRTELVISDLDRDRAALEAYEFAAAKDTLPATAMPAGWKCRSCSFRAICKDPVPSLVADLFTTPDERARDRAERQARNEARIAAGSAPLPDLF